MDKESNEKVSPIVTELFLRGMKLNISFVFFYHSLILKYINL